MGGAKDDKDPEAATVTDSQGEPVIGSKKSVTARFSGISGLFSAMKSVSRREK